jgi:cystathionine beta-lyase
VIDDKELASQIVSSTKLFKLAESLGGVKSLCCLPCEMTHKSIPAEKRYSSGVTDSLIRLSVGLEDADDLIADLKQAIETAVKQNAEKNTVTA